MKYRLLLTIGLLVGMTPLGGCEDPDDRGGAPTGVLVDSSDDGSPERAPLVATPDSCHAIKANEPDAPTGPYLVDPNGGSEEDAFEVYCEMTTGGGGWTLVDNDAVAAETFVLREPGANSDISVTRGSVLPAYAWSDDPQLLCISSNHGGTANWVTFRADNEVAKAYPTSTTGQGKADKWTALELNGNRDYGDTSYVFVTTYGNQGAFWVGSDTNATCACNYNARPGAQTTGVGAPKVSGSKSTCSTWVR